MMSNHAKVGLKLSLLLNHYATLDLEHLLDDFAADGFEHSHSLSEQPYHSWFRTLDVAEQLCHN